MGLCPYLLRRQENLATSPSPPRSVNLVLTKPTPNASSAPRAYRTAGVGWGVVGVGSFAIRDVFQSVRCAQTGGEGIEARTPSCSMLTAVELFVLTSGALCYFTFSTLRNHCERIIAAGAA